MDLSKKRIAHIVFESNDRASRTFDVVVLIMIVGSVTVVILDSVLELHLKYGKTFYFLEWVFTILFTIEYALRIWLTNRTFSVCDKLLRIVDLLAILPGYLGLFHCKYTAFDSCQGPQIT